MADIKDSGQRTEFFTGAKRDMHDGKQNGLVALGGYYGGFQALRSWCEEIWRTQC